jgi:arylsulfatase A
MAVRAAIPAEQPNILLVLADDLSPEHLGCYGGKTIPTPHLDRMAARGLLFQTAWVTPMCGPSRAMIMTGCGAQRIGTWHNSLTVRADGKNPNAFAKYHVTLPRLLRSAGYATAIGGKLHELGGEPLSPEVGFDEACLHEKYGVLPEGGLFEGAWETRESLPGWGKPVTSRFWHPCIVENGKTRPTGPEDFGDDIFADFLLDFIRRQNDEGRPAFGFFSMGLPHTIAGEDAELPTTPLSGRPGCLTSGTWEECVRYVDALVGRLQKGLEDRGLADNTILIFTTDNGDQATGAKGSATESGCRVPLIMTGPEPVIGWKGVSSELFSLADLLPTFAAWAGAAVPSVDAIDGVDQSGVIAGTEKGRRTWLYSCIGTARMIRTAEWCLEAVDPLGGFPQGRLYWYQEGGGRQQMRDNPENRPAVAARADLVGILETIPYLDLTLPHVAAAVEKYGNAPHRHRLVPSYDPRDLADPSIGK